MKRLLAVVAVFVSLAGAAVTAPAWLEDACACGGSKLSLGGYPVGGGQWQCLYIVNGQTLVTEYHYGGCP